MIALDQTGWKRRTKKSKDMPFQMWCLTAPGAVLHAIKDDKSADTFVTIVDAFSGTIDCDMLATHPAGARASPGDIILAGCWAHAFRKFRDAAPNRPDAIQMMNWISELYDLDAKAGDDADAR